MKKKLLISMCLLAGLITVLPAQTFKTITVVESIIPNGTGRSRMLESLEDRNYLDFTSVQSDNKKERNKSKRGDIRVKNFQETKLLNFFNLGGIRMQNIIANDALVTSKLNDMAAKGWILAFVTTGVESWGGDKDRNGIFVTRYIFKKK